MSEQRLVCCHGCGLPHKLAALPKGHVARCKRCGDTLAGAPHLNHAEHLMLYLAASIFFAVAHLFPFLSLELEGRTQTVTVLDGVRALYHDGSAVLAVIVFATGTLAPALRIGFGIALYMPLALHRIPKRLILVMRSINELKPWAMMEIYLFAVIVAYVKLTDIATIETGAALMAFVATILILMLLDGDHEPHDIWELVEPQNSSHDASNTVACHECHQVMADNESHCSRCNAPVHARRPGSLAVSWALLITAAILLVPANIMPIMNVTSFGNTSESTILGGVIELVEYEMYPVAAVVFIASIAVPFLKLIGLFYIFASVTFHWRTDPVDRSAMYRFIEFIGRWSMIDIFVIALLAALVAIGNIATIEAGPAALCFAAVVIISMLAAMAFDPRLIWDSHQEATNQKASGNNTTPAHKASS